LILMSLRRGAPYNDRLEEEGTVLMYEEHDAPMRPGEPSPKNRDQPQFYPSGRLTQNGLFLGAVDRFKNQGAPPERVKVFEKIRVGIWVYNGLFLLTDARAEQSNGRRVFKFRLELASVEVGRTASPNHQSEERDRLIPSSVKLEVWKRDKGRCVLCGSEKNLHFDHIIPFSLGGTSRNPNNVQILCQAHNLEKRDRIQ